MKNTIRIVAVSARDRSKDRGVDLSPYAWEDDMIAMATAETIGSSVLERLRRVRQSLSNEVTNPLNPIGD